MCLLDILRIIFLEKNLKSPPAPHTPAPTPSTTLLGAIQIYSPAYSYLTIAFYDFTNTAVNPTPSIHTFTK